MTWLYIIIVGAIAGWLAGLIMKGSGFGLLGNIIIGIIGGFLGNWVFGTLNISIGSGMMGDVITAGAGAVVLLFIAGLFKK